MGRHGRWVGVVYGKGWAVGREWTVLLLENEKGDTGGY